MPQTNVYTVLQITAYIKSLFTGDPLLADVWLSAEVSGFTQATSGHCYFTLKDASAVIKAVIWRTQAGRMTLPRNGEAVLAHGYISVYEQGGAYQFYVDHIEPAGAGRLWLEFERLRGRLEAEGLFAAERKRAIPPRPARLGVATSPTAAALRDILRTLAARWPLVEVILAPTPVQGEQAPPGIVAAIQALNRWSAEREPLDAIILARGGGSIEELWAFNDERVARAIVASATPIITGVGHETDFTIADFAADLRAATPTAAATLATPDRRDLAASLASLTNAAHRDMTDRLAAARERTAGLTRRLARLSPEARLASNRQRVDEMHRRAALAMASRLREVRERLTGQQLRLAALDPTAVLARGYAIVSLPNGAVVTSVGQVKPHDALHVRVADGAFDVTVDGR
ncbi:MAG: exodeoxyribonuclease VII large subunit [Chloroflexi bacterium]|nr:exodeoxyribonuclease VII large subunit [Chloroflexota bacterium]